MFNKKSCRKCGKKISNKYIFCPGCGTQINNFKKEDWGLLGKADSEEQVFESPFFAGFSGKILQNMIGNVMKMLEKEMHKEMKEVERPSSRTNFKLMINGKEVQFGEQNRKRSEEPRKIVRNEFNDEQLNIFLKFPKEEPKINLRRLGDKIVYELDMPGVTSFKDILINRLENSIEIKAIGKERSYFKIIPVNIPIRSHKLVKGKLILELNEN